MRSRGKKIVLAVISVNLVMNAAAIVYGVFSSGAGNLLPMTVHMILAVVLFCFLYRGRPWARWVTAVLFAISGLAGIPGAVIMYFMLIDMLFCILAGVSSLIQVISAALLIFSPSIREYFKREFPDEP